MNKYRKQIVIGILMILVVTVSLPALLRPQPARALFGLGDLSITIGDIPNMIWRAIDKGLKVATDVTFKNMLNQYINNLAYNYAVKLATGESGQKPLFFDLNTVLESAADQAVGEFASQLLVATTGGGHCQYATDASGQPISCVADSQCPLIARVIETPPDDYSPEEWFNGSYSYRFTAGFTHVIVESEADFEQMVEYELVEDGGLQRDKCQAENDANFAGIDICRIGSPAAEIVIKNIALQVQTPPKPRCTFSQLKQTFEDLRQIDTGGLIRVSEQFNARSNEIAIIQNLTTGSIEQRSAAIAQRGLEVETGQGLRGVEETVTDKTKTPATYVEEATKESFFRAPLRSLTTRTGSMVADALGTFVNTFAAKMLQKVFNDGFTPDAPGSSIRFSANGSTLSGVAAARLKFADLQKLTDIKLRERDPSGLLQQLTTGCSLESTQSTGVSTLRVDALRETNNCVIDESFRLAVEQGLTVGEAINYKGEASRQILIDPNRDFGVHADGSGTTALAGLGCEGCDPEVYSLRSILVLKKYGIVPVGWELAARYISEVLQPSGVAQAFSLGELVQDYSNPESPFYRLVDPNWQLKAPPSVKEIRGPGERIIASFPVRDKDSNNDGTINELDEVSQVIQRGAEASDEQTCIYENEDGTCAYWGYCTEQTPFWRIAGSVCEERYSSCQVYTRGSDNTRVSYVSNTADKNICDPEVAGCLRFATNRDAVTNDWINSDLAADNILADRGAPLCDATAAGCSEFLQLTDLRGNILPALSTGGGDSVEDVILAVQSAAGDVNSYKDYAFVKRLYFDSGRVDCTGTEDFDGDGTIDIDGNVACRMYSPVSYRGPEVPGVYTPATIDSDGVVTAYNDECPAECVGFQPYEESATAPLYPFSGFVDFIADTAQSCSASAVGCTEFTNLNDISQGGEGLEYYSQLRECVVEGTAGLETYFTWEGSDETGFQLRSWRLLSNGSGPLHTGDSDYNLCTAAIYNLPPEDPSANPDCREYIDVSLNKYYRLASRVVVGSDECQPLRRTLTDVNYSGTIDSADCTAGGGTWDGSGCIHYALPSDSISCGSSFVGCRAYQGFAAGNEQVLTYDVFESGTTDGWDGGTVSNDSLILGGHSLYLSGGVIDSIRKTVTYRPGGNYIISFWAKGTASVSATITNGYVTLSLGSVSLTPNWTQYTLGPVQFDNPNALGNIELSGFASGQAYLDNIKLSESNDLFLISNSWITPNICTTPESQLYCEEYEDDRGITRYIKNFSRLCQEEFVGCEALVDTHNSDDAAGASYAGGVSSIDDVAIPADSIAYIVNDQDHYCKQADAGCTELGRRNVDRDGSVSFDEEYRILDPDFYATSLCSLEAELCEEYIPAGGLGGFPQYFKDPQDRVCEYRTNVIVPPSNTVQSGWFKVGANPITADDVCQTGDIPNNEITAPVCNFDYVRGAFEDPLEIATDFNATRYTPPGVGCYTYRCPADASSCTEYQDPLSPELCDRELGANEGRCVGSDTICSGSADCGGAQCDKSMACDYYYFLKETLDDGVSECQGQIDPGIGCVGFFETRRGEDSKYLRSDCQAGCALIKRCYNVAGGTYGSAACSSDLDCGMGSECRGAPVREYPNCDLDTQLDDPNSKPGCVI